MTQPATTQELIADVLNRHFTDDEIAYNVACEIERDPALTVRPRVVISGEWRDVRDALDKLPEGTRIVIANGDLAVKRDNVFGRPHWRTTRASVESSETIARDNTPIEVIA